jgi:hypothetical protein
MTLVRNFTPGTECHDKVQNFFFFFLYGPPEVPPLWYVVPKNYANPATLRCDHFCNVKKYLLVDGAVVVSDNVHNVLWGQFCKSVLTIRIYHNNQKKNHIL